MYLSLIVYFIVSLMRLEAFALGALQMSYYYYYYKPDGILPRRVVSFITVTLHLT